MNTEELVKKAINAIKARDLEAAEKHAGALLALNQEVSSHYILYGNIKLEKHETTDAIKAYEQAFRIDPTNIEACNNLAIAHKLNGDVELGLRSLETAHELSPDRPEICYNLANFSRQTGDTESAEKWYLETIRLDPSFVRGYNNLGNLYEQSGKHGLAAEYFSKGLEIDPDHPSLSYNYGVTLEALGDDHQAVEQYERALRAKPNWAEGLNNLGIALQKIGSHEESQKAFEKLISIHPDSARAQNNLAMLFSDLGEYEKAESLLQKAVEIDPNYERATLNLSHVSESRGDLISAEMHLRSFLDRNPTDNQARHRYANVLVQSNRLNEALKHLQKALKADAGDTNTLVAIGSLMLRGKKPKRALRYLTKAEKNSPDEIEIKLLKAQAHRDLGNVEKGIAELSLVLQQDLTNHDARLLLSELYVKNNLYSEAKSLLDELNAEFVDDQDVLSATIRTLNAMGEREQAIKVAEQLVNIQNSSGNADDLDNLNATLELYEQIVDEYAEENEEIWSRNLGILVATPEQAYETEHQMEEASLVFHGLPDFEEETVPIIEVGGIEPVIVVDEEEEVVSLQDLEEDIEPPDDDDEEDTMTPVPTQVITQVLSDPSIQQLTQGIGGQGDFPRSTGGSGNYSHGEVPSDAESPGQLAPLSSPLSSVPEETSQYGEAETVHRGTEEQAPSVEVRMPQQPIQVVVVQAPPSDTEGDEVEAQDTGADTNPADPIPPSLDQESPNLDSDAESLVSDTESDELLSEPGTIDEQSSDELSIIESDEDISEPEPAPVEAADQKHASERDGGETSQAGTKAPQQKPKERTSVRERPVDNGQGGEKEDKVNPRQSAALLARLERLSFHLPADAKQFFDQHELYLRMETLRRKLSGQSGIHTIETEARNAETNITIPAVIDTLDFLGKLAKDIPEERIGLALTTKITHIVDNIRSKAHG